MCGLIGVLSDLGLQENDVKNINNASKILKHRGPDFQGIWSGDDVIMAHDKLSIQNTTANSNQPLVSKSNVLAFNGEIYNWKQLKAKYSLQSCEFDGDVVLKLYDMFGISFLSEIEGDFAIAIYDKKQKKMFLIRDRLGVKPLLYTKYDHKLYFTSEAKAFNAIPEVFLKPNAKHIISDLALWFWNDKKETYFENIFNVEPGEYLEITSGKIEHHKYWDIGQNKVETLSDQEILSELRNSANSRTQGKVKWASLLSGGLDSSLVTALVSKNSKKVQTYTIKYDDFNNNKDLQYARQVAKKYSNLNFKTNHVPKEDISIEKLVNLSYNMEEVVWDKVYYAIFKNYYTASKDGFRIVLNGQGSDEVWLGYYHDFPMYKFAEEDFNLTNLLESFIDQNLGNAEYLQPKSLDIVRKQLKLTMLKNIPVALLKKDTLNAMAYWATKTYLQSNLMQEDRLSMASSIESRSPFLNYHVVDLAFSMDSSEKVKNGNEKYPLKKISLGILPSAISQRQKQAFVNPTDKYNDNILNYMKLHADEIISTTFFKENFSSELLKQFKEARLNEDLSWKLVAIAKFLNMFTKEGNFEK